MYLPCQPRHKNIFPRLIKALVLNNVHVGPDYSMLSFIAEIKCSRAILQSEIWKRKKEVEVVWAKGTTDGHVA